ncbi:hypothetical protein PIROE2DRAFT_69260 [Piromyces sp. E2]|nr:hypothetical protein PIROE2DRAFT_69260 [Piromyces sp. E2]|eukprot:OUM64308.1 hypothetical protein PIROE2DRAFT_69260 [Piromyces sp. E2]
MDFNNSGKDPVGVDTEVSQVTQDNTQDNTPPQHIIPPTHSPPPVYSPEQQTKPTTNVNTDTTTDMNTDSNTNVYTNTNTNTNTNTGDGSNTGADSNTNISQDLSTSNTVSGGQITPIQTPTINKPPSKQPSIEGDDKKSPISTTTIVGISSAAVLLVIAIVAFIFLKKRKRNNKNDGQNNSEKEESVYQIGSEFLKTDNQITLPFNDSNSITSDVISESAFYKHNSNLFNTPNNKSDVVIDVPVNKTSIDNENRSDPYTQNQNQNQVNESNLYHLDVNFDTPTLDLAFPKPALKSSLSSNWFPEDSSNNVNNKETPDNAKARYVTNNVISSPEKVLATEEMLRIDSEYDTKDDQETKRASASDQGIEIIGENIRLQTPTPVSNAGSSSSVGGKEKSSSDEIIRHSPQVNLTPKKSILKKSSASRAYNGGTPTRNTSVKKTTTIGRSTSTRNKNGSGSMSNDNLSGNMSQSLGSAEEEIVSLQSIGRTNTVNSVATTASNMTGVRLPPAFTAFHHALPTPPTPKSTKFLGTDGELLPGQVVNEELMVPDVLNDAMERHDIHRNQNFPGSYCTIRRKSKNPNVMDDSSKKQNLEIKSSGHRRNRTQDFTRGSDKLEYYTANPSANNQEFNSNKENYQYNMPSNIKDSYPSKPPRRSNGSGLHHSKTLPRNFNSSKKYNDYETGAYAKHKPYNIEEEKAKLTMAMSKNEVMSNRIKRNSMEADILIQNANVSLTCFEEDLLKNSITEKDKLKDVNSVMSILREERFLLKQPGLETPK